MPWSAARKLFFTVMSTALAATLFAAERPTAFSAREHAGHDWFVPRRERQA